MSLTIFQGKFQEKEGCLFTLNKKKYIYAGLQKDKKGNSLHTFYGLDGLDKDNLKNFEINNAVNESVNKDGAVVKMVESAIYNEYKPGIPEKLRLAPGFPEPAAFYEIPGEDGTPKRITSIPKTKEEINEMIKASKYVYRVGSNGPSLTYIKEGKMNDIKKFINDYNKMKFIEKQNTDNQPKTAAIIEKKTWFSRSNTDNQPKPDKPDTPDSSLKPSYFSSFMGRKGGRTKRYKKLKRSKTYKN